MRSISALFCGLLVACTTVNYRPEDLAPAPKVSQAISGELAKLVDPTSAWVNGCSTVKFDPNHIVCSGKFSFLSSLAVRQPYERAAKSALPSGMKLDFSAEESFASRVVSDVIYGVVLAVAGGLSGGHYYGNAWPDREALAFSLPEIDRIP